MPAYVSMSSNTLPDAIVCWSVLAYVGHMPGDIISTAGSAAGTRVNVPLSVCGAWVVGVAQDSIGASTADLLDLVRNGLRLVAVLAVRVGCGLGSLREEGLDKRIRAASAGLDILDVAGPAPILHALGNIIPPAAGYG